MLTVIGGLPATGKTAVRAALVCSEPMLDPASGSSAKPAHRRRAETREVDIPDRPLPSWEKIQVREYEPWERDHLVIDTALIAVDSAVATIQRAQTVHTGR